MKNMTMNALLIFVGLGGVGAWATSPIPPNFDCSIEHGNQNLQATSKSGGFDNSIAEFISKFQLYKYDAVTYKATLLETKIIDTDTASLKTEYGDQEQYLLIRLSYKEVMPGRWESSFQEPSKKVWMKSWVYEGTSVAICRVWLQ